MHKDGWVIAAKRKRGKTPDDENEIPLPILSPGTEYFFYACLHLFSERMPGMSLSAIPWSKVYQYACATGYRNWEQLFNVVSHVDMQLRDDDKKASDTK